MKTKTDGLEESAVPGEQRRAQCCQEQLYTGSDRTGFFCPNSAKRKRGGLTSGARKESHKTVVVQETVKENTIRKFIDFSVFFF